MPPPSWAKRATKLAPKPKPTMRNGRDRRVVQAAEEDEDPVDAEERQGDDEEAGDRPAAHGDLDRLDEAAPGGGRGPDVGLDADVHADDARRPSSRRRRRGRRRRSGCPGRCPKYSVSATSFVSTTAMIAPRMTAAKRARMAIVRYWRRMNATAPSKIVAATSSISLVPVSRRSTSRAR